MYTAKEAREKAENSISDKTKEQLLAAEHCIESAVNTIPMGTLPHLRRKNQDENQTGHRGEKPHCVLPEVQKGNSYGY